MYPNKKEGLMERYKLACDLKQEISIDIIKKYVEKNYRALGLIPKPLKEALSLVEFFNGINKENYWDSTWSSILCIGAYEISESDKKKIMDIYYPIFQAMENGLWLYSYLPNCFWWVRIPKVKTINGNRLHCTNGPAFELPKEKYFFLNGVEVNEELVMTPAEKIDPAILLKEKNAEVRREIVRKIGIERVCSKLNAQCIDRQDDYELLLLDLGEGRKRPYLKMKNPSIATYHIEGVSPEIKTVKEALAWRNGIEGSPEVLT